MSQVSVNCKFPQTSVKTVFEGLQKRVPVISFIATCHNARNHAAMQSQKAVTAYLKSKQPLHFDFARSVVEPRSSCSEISRWRTENKIHCFKKTISAVEYGPIRSFNTELTLLLREPIFHVYYIMNVSIDIHHKFKVTSQPANFSHGCQKVLTIG